MRGVLSLLLLSVSKSSSGERLLVASSLTVSSCLKKMTRSKRQIPPSSLNPVPKYIQDQIHSQEKLRLRASAWDCEEEAREEEEGRTSARKKRSRERRGEERRGRERDGEKKQKEKSAQLVRDPSSYQLFLSLLVSSCTETHFCDTLPLLSAKSYLILSSTIWQNRKTDFKWQTHHEMHQ